MSPVMIVPSSTESLIMQLSEDQEARLPWAAEAWILRTLMERYDCEWCQAKAGQMCQTYGGVPELRRTHPVRLSTTATQRRRLVAQALVEVARLRDEDDAEQ